VHVVHRSILVSLLTLTGCAATRAAEPSPEVAQHRAARACQALPEADRRAPLFGGAIDVADTRPVIVRRGKQMDHRTLGAELYVRAERDLTAPYLHRLASCQIARYEADLAESATDPLAVAGAQVDVRRRAAGFVVRITAEARSAGRAIAERAARL
jgi:hypothetical protein